MAVVIIRKSGDDWFGRGVYLRVAVQTCGSDQVQMCRGDILLVLDRAVEQLQTDWPEGERLIGILPMEVLGQIRLQTAR